MVDVADSVNAGRAESSKMYARLLPTNQTRAPVNPVHEERTDKERAQRLDRRHEEQKSDDLCVFATGLSMRDDLN